MTSIQFRNDDFGSGFSRRSKPNALELISDEIEELNNEDIIDYLQSTGATVETLSDVINHIEKNLNQPIDNLYALWLTSYEGVVKHYEGNPENISAYEVPSNAMIISDLADEGQLYISTKPFKETEL